MIIDKAWGGWLQNVDKMAWKISLNRWLNTWGINHMDFHRSVILDRINRKRKDPQAEICFVQTRNNWGQYDCSVEWWRETIVRDGVTEVRSIGGFQQIKTASDQCSNKISAMLRRICRTNKQKKQGNHLDVRHDGALN